MKSILLSLLLFTACYNVINGQQTIDIDIASTSIQWEANNLFQFGGHYGIVNLSNGFLIKAGDQYTGGRFVIDMNTIANTDGDYSEGLVSHLKDPDFFEVNKYPTAILEITHIKYEKEQIMTLTADLTIKGQTNSISFPGFIEEYKIKTAFYIDRTRWDITYGAKGFVDRMKNTIISDAIKFEVAIILEDETSDQ